MGRRCVVPEDEEGSDAGGGGELSSPLTKKTPESRSWILMDASGQEMILEVDKYVIMRRVKIHSRDFRILDPLVSYPSKILCRDRAIILNLEHIKAIITAEEVLILNPLDDKVIPFVEGLRRRLQPVNFKGPDKADGSVFFSQHDVESEEEDESPFEFRALEVALEAICIHLDACSTELENDVYPALDMLTSKVTRRNLDILLKLKSQMTGLIARVEKVKDEIDQLLDDDHDMAALHLSRKLVARSSRVSASAAAKWSMYTPTIASKKSGAGRASSASHPGHENDVEGLEMLLEAYLIHIDGTLTRLATLHEYIDSTEDFINVQIDNRRNQLYQLDLFLNSGLLSLNINSLVTGVFGMNIPFTWSKDGYGYTFKWVVIGSSVVTALLYISLVAYAGHKGLYGSWTA